MRVIAGLLLLILGGSFWSCYPGGAEFVDQLDVVGTRYDEAFNFDQVNRYVLIEDVEHSAPTGQAPTTKYDQDILDEIELQLDGRSWERIEPSDTITLGDVLIVRASLFETDNSGVAWFPPTWCWWSPCYPGGWNPWYPWGGGGVIYNYQTGTLIVEMVDPVDNSEEDVPVVWLSALNGLAQGSDANVRARLDRGIKQAFDHPPFNN